MKANGEFKLISSRVATAVTARFLLIAILSSPRCTLAATPPPAMPPVPAPVPADESARLLMVETQIAARGVSSPAVLDAMRRAQRHLFVPNDQLAHAYEDRPLPIGYGQTISQPYIVALMTELVRPEPHFHVLEIGAGSGYQAAVLAELVDRVTTVEIIEPLSRRAATALAEAGYSNVSVHHADGYYGWEEQAPFDAIVVTAAAPHIPPPLIEQLKDGGRMVIPVGSLFRTQQLVLVEKRDGVVTTRNILPVRFVPFTRDPAPESP